jgi:putative DNA primase/helicase
MIPDELKPRKQWVCWRYETREGKKTKVPYQSNRKPASSTDPATWTTFDDVTKAQGFDGIGFVVTFPYTGIDIDHCRNPQTGELSEYAKSVIATLNSYSEVTPSNAGIRVWVKGKLIGSGNKNNKLNIEFYDNARFFTVTGNHLDGTPLTIEERQAELTGLHARTFPKEENPRPVNESHPVNLADAELINKARSANNGESFRKLWEGDTSAHNNDDSAADLALCCHLAFWTGNDTVRMDTLFRQSGLYREKWERQDYQERTIRKAIESTRETYNPHNGNAPDKPMTSAQQSIGNPINLTDYTNAEYLTEMYGDMLRYDHRRGRWLIWDKNRWRPDTDAAILRYAASAARERYRQAAKIENLKERERVANWAIGSENRSRLDSCIALTKSVKPIADDGENWDSDPYLLGVPNGVIDLRTGMLRAGRREDRITMTTSVEYDPDAKAPRFEQFMTEIFNGDAELVDWVWRELGYSLTGDMSEQIIIMGYGEGANGKGKLTAAVKSAFGDYAADTPFSTFELYSRVSIPNDLAALEHKRFIFSSETNDGTRLNEGRLKAISGGDPITARFLNQEFFTFQPECKIHLFVNSKPVVQDDSYGFWRRARLTPFLRQFKGKDDDKKLGDKLKTEAPGILALFVRGCLEWQKRGLDPVPAAIRTATSEYKVESDPLASFLSECVEDGTSAVKASAFYKSYGTWSEENKLKKSEILSTTEFGTRMSKRYKKEHRRDGWYYMGIRPSDGGIMVADFPETVTGLEENLNVRDGLDTPNGFKSNSKQLTRDNCENQSQPVTERNNPSQYDADLPPDIPPTPSSNCVHCGKKTGYTFDFKNRKWLCMECGK